MLVTVDLIDEEFEMLGRGATATADDADVVLLDKLDHRGGVRLRLEGVDLLSIHVEGQARVGDGGNRQSGMFAQIADRFSHVFGAGRAV